MCVTKIRTTHKQTNILQIQNQQQTNTELHNINKEKDETFTADLDGGFEL